MTTDGAEPSEQDLNSVENQIKACQPLTKKNKNDKPAIIMRFANRKHKMELLRQGRKLKDTQVYLNEHLTKKNGNIARKA